MDDIVYLFDLGTRYLAEGEGFALLEHTLPPRTLGSPLHRHTSEDEYSYVLEGRLGAQLGDEVVEAGPGELVQKPRGQQHAFWNAGDEPLRSLKTLPPAASAPSSRQPAPVLAAGEGDGVRKIAARYELEID